MRTLFILLNSLLELYKLALLASIALSWLRVPSNKWTVMLQRVVEPVVGPVRRFLRAHLPTQWQMLDWSAAVVYLLVGLVQSFLRMTLGMMLW